jgi:hypothetical protein
MELVAVMSGLSVVIGTTAVLTAFLLRMGGEMRERTHMIAALERLAEQFRRDVHAIQGEPSLGADHRTAEFHLAGGRTIRWRIDDREGAVRMEHASQRVDREDTYALPQGTTAAFEAKPQAAGRIVALRINSTGNGGPSLAVEALVGRDERLAAEEKP